ncbi:MAG: DUF3303 domain-containing protein [Dehalococcoidia bacterium]|nr:hypothetical protein [Chloroflexota bacterium]|tara:strand:- start:262 stop:579 length:318 start_codon:yes stop_codon:yes gene_type:complete
MLFHIIAQHDHITCPRVKEGKVVDSFESVPLGTNNPWMDGSENVKVHGVWGYPVGHRVFAVIEADKFEDVVNLFEFHLGQGPVEILPVRDALQSRRNALSQTAST